MGILRDANGLRMSAIASHGTSVLGATGYGRGRPHLRSFRAPFTCWRLSGPSHPLFDLSPRQHQLVVARFCALVSEHSLERAIRGTRALAATRTDRGVAKRKYDTGTLTNRIKRARASDNGRISERRLLAVVEGIHLRCMKALEAWQSALGEPRTVSCRYS